VDAGPDLTACLNTPGVTLSGLVSGPTTTGEWSSQGDGVFNPEASEVNAVYQPGAADLDAGSVQLVLTSTNNNGCLAGTDSLVIHFQPMPQVEAGEDLVGCSSTVFELSGTASDWSSVEWSTSGGGSFVSADQLLASYVPSSSDAGGTVQFILQVSNGCGIVTDTLYAEVLVSPEVSFSYESGCGSTVVNYLNGSAGADEFTWSFGDGSPGSQEMNPLHDHMQPGSYTVTLTASNGSCSSSTSQTVVVPETPVAAFSASTGELAVYEELYLTDGSFGAVSWQWNMGDGTTDVTDQDPLHVYNHPGTYQIILQVTNAQGCTDTASVTVLVTEAVEPGPDVLPIGIPSAFSPNGDGNNDVFFVRGGPFTEFDLRIYNNWGVLLFSAERQTDGWDGSYKGQPQPVGVYVHTFRGTTADGVVVDRAGEVTIIR
jgi:gliding motility-associated-like protein